MGYYTEELNRMGKKMSDLTLDELKQIRKQKQQKVKESLNEKKVKINISGEEKTIKEWSNTSGVPEAIIRMRIKYGLKGKKLLQPTREKAKASEKKYTHREFTIGDTTKTLKDWSIHTGITLNTLISRVRSGRTGYDLIAPIDNRGRK